MDIDTQQSLGEGKLFGVLVDRAQPVDGDNQSGFFRFIKLVHLTNHVNTCNRAGMSISSSFCGVPTTYPLAGSIDECGMYEIHELAAFYIESMLAFDHPRRSKIAIKDDFLNAITRASCRAAPSTTSCSTPAASTA